MARDESVSDRIYALVRSELRDGVISPGARLDLAALASRHRTSATPVREALARLLGEGLLHFTPRRGYSAHSVTRAALEDLYEWAGALSDLAARSIKAQAGAARTSGGSQSKSAGYVARLSTLNALLLANLPNNHARVAFSHVQVRLRVAFVSESLVVGGADEEIQAILQAFDKGKGVRVLPRRFYARRRASAAAIVGHVLARLANGV